MKTKIQKWGNSLAVRIPKSFADETHLEQNSIVEVSLVEGKLMVAPVLEPGPSLEQLLAEVDDGNLHHEIETGPPVGIEAW